MRADRLLSILMRIQPQGRATAPELASALEVSVRTIHRDIEALCTAGVPIVTDRGRYGGYSLVKGYRTRLTGISSLEAGALPFVGLEVAAALGLQESSEAAWLKLLAALPPEGGEDARRRRERFHLDPVDWYQRIPTPVTLRVIASATWSSNRIRIEYESWRAKTTRTIEPLGLVVKAGRWYLVACKAGGTKARIFSLENIHHVEVLDGQFRAPSGFNLSRSWRSEVERFESSLKRSVATIRVAEGAMSRIDRLGGENAEAIRKSVPDTSGWRRAEIFIEGIPHASSLIMGFATDIEVIAPAELRQEIGHRATGLRALYAGDSGRHPLPADGKSNLSGR